MAHIAVIGLGYVGLTSALGLANLGHSIIGIDIDKQRLTNLKSGHLPIHEPGMEKLLLQSLKDGSVSWEESYDAVDERIEFAIVCVSTPSSPNGEADLTNLEAALQELKIRMPSGSVVVVRSTVPIGTTQTYVDEFSRKAIGIAFNPEFFSEGKALTGFYEPSRIVVGAAESETAERVLSLYSGIHAPKVVCDLTAAETIKHASNSYLALRLSFVNELAMLCEVTGASYQSVAKGIGLDSRIGKEFLLPGPGWGGSCFPKDTRELIATSSKLGSPMRTIEAAFNSNDEHMNRVVMRIVELLGGDVNGKKIAAWGLTFKAGTDDLRESPAIKIAMQLFEMGANVSAYDPTVSQSNLPELKISQSPLDVCKGSDALLVLTEWPEFANLSPSDVRKTMNTASVVCDLRGVLKEDLWGEEFTNFWKIAN